MNTFGSITYEFFNNKKNYHFDLTGAFSNIIEAVSGSFCGVTQNTCSTGTIRVPSLQKWMKRSIIFM